MVASTEGGEVTGAAVRVVARLLRDGYGTVGAWQGGELTAICELLEELLIHVCVYETRSGAALRYATPAYYLEFRERQAGRRKGAISEYTNLTTAREVRAWQRENWPS